MKMCMVKTRPKSIMYQLSNYITKDRLHILFSYGSLAGQDTGIDEKTHQYMDQILSHLRIYSDDQNQWHKYVRVKKRPYQ